MEPTIKAILARFNGDRIKAYEYCIRTACAFQDKTPMQKEYFGHAMLFSPPRVASA